MRVICLYKCLMYKKISTRQAAVVLGVSHTTFYRKYRKIAGESVSNGRRFGTSE